MDKGTWPAFQPGYPSSKHHRLRTPFLKKVQHWGLSVMERRGMIHSSQGSPNGGDMTPRWNHTVLDLSFHSPDVCPWASYLTSLSLDFLICIMAIMLLISRWRWINQREAPAGSITQGVSAPSLPLGLSQVCLCSFLHITVKCKYIGSIRTLLSAGKNPTAPQAVLVYPCSLSFALSLPFIHLFIHSLILIIDWNVLQASQIPLSSGQA